MGSETLCPNQVGLYRCKTSIRSLEWLIQSRLQDEGGLFNGFSLTGSKVPIGPHAVAYLIDREVDDTNLGNRTSILEYTPDPSIVGNITVTCEFSIECSKTVMIVGESCMSL